jgi:hypothetical protein
MEKKEMYRGVEELDFIEPITMIKYCSLRVTEMVMKYKALQPYILPPDLPLLILLFVGGFVVIIVLGLGLVLVYYVYRRSIQRKAKRAGVYIGENIPSRRVWNTCKNVGGFLLCAIFLIIVFVPQLIFSIPIDVGVEEMLLLVWVFVILWAIGIPILMIIITIADCLWIRNEYLSAIGEKSPRKKSTEYTESETEYNEE